LKNAHIFLQSRVHQLSPRPNYEEVLAAFVTAATKANCYFSDRYSPEE
jgi:hypothetical protein